MNVKVNGEDISTNAANIRELIDQEDLSTGDKGIAVAVNGSVVPKGRWKDHRLSEEDVIEVVRATQGG